MKGRIHVHGINLGEAILRQSENIAGFKFISSNENYVPHATIKVLELIRTNARFELFWSKILIKSKEINANRLKIS